MILPHDAETREHSGKTREEMLRNLGFETRIVSRMNPEDRVEMVLRYLPMMWWDEDECAEGLRALEEYQEDYNEKLEVSRGPLHNWASHPADSFGHAVQAYEQPEIEPHGRAA